MSDILPAEPLPDGPPRHQTCYTPPGYRPPPPGILCPQLYTALESRLDGGVLVSCLGEAQVGIMTSEVRENRQINRWRVQHWGETYRVCCPFCGDSRYRLWINHRYGQADPAFPEQRGSFYGICFNEGCLENSENREQLYDRVFGLRNRNERAPPMQVVVGTQTDTRLIARDMPGRVERLTAVPHLPGLAYMMADRRFDAATLDRYEVCLCLEVAREEYRPAQGRIIFPIRMYGQLVGWQARFIGKPPNKYIPKYFTCPRMPARQVLYNYDRAKQSPYIVVFEGPTDVMRYGDCSMALLGKRLKYEQSLLLGATFNNRQPIIFCLDPDAYEESALAIHQMQQLCPNPVLRVALPDGWDPADMDREALHAHIVHQSKARGITLPEKIPAIAYG